MDSRNIRLHPVKLLLESIVFVWWYRSKFISCLSIPTLLLVSIWALHHTIPISISIATGWAFLLAYQIGFVLFAVACHRLVLLNEMSFSVSLVISKRIGVFLFWSILSTSGFFVITGAILTIAANLPVISQVFEEPDFVFVVYSLSTIPAFYVLGRFILIFPATAVDAKSGLCKSWRQTKGNGWKIVLVIGLYPWLISVIIWLIAREKASLLEQVIAGLLYYAGLALEITALSLTYKLFTQIANKDEKYA